MNRFRNLLIIGTSHISGESLKNVEDSFTIFNPDIVAIELDRKRYLGLFQKRKKASAVEIIKNVGLKGYLLLLIGGWVERKLGEKTGIMPGSEMRLAIRLAKKNNAVVALIDQDIEVTLRNFSAKFSWEEKWRMLSEIILSPFSGKKIEFDISRVPERKIIKKILEEVKEKYPNVYLVLIEERNIVMANNLAGIMNNFPGKKVLAVVGAGHEDEIMSLVKKKIGES